jgi:hypothetical protein
VTPSRSTLLTLVWSTPSPRSDNWTHAAADLMMRDLIIQGMRRTGTTVLFDTFVRDPRFETYYEPLNAVPETPSLGGGSGTHQVDLFAAVRQVRATFERTNPAFDQAAFNHGGPSNPEVEVEADLPPLIRDYLEALLKRPGPKVMKFVRMGAKVRHLSTVSPDAVLAWPVRDPREVVRSYLLGRYGETAKYYPSADAVFTVASARNPWSVHRLSEALIDRDGLTFAAPLADAERVLLVWADSVRTMERDGPRYFGERALRLRHEDFCAAPNQTLDRIFEQLGDRPDVGTVRWCEETVRPAAKWEHSADPRWEQLLGRVGAAELATDLGYL